MIAMEEAQQKNPNKVLATYVNIANSGFKRDEDKLVSDALDSKGGFTWVLAGAKHGLNTTSI